ncbi:hypothetical protein C2G38_2240915 [Gigaspora rosea]|uniref:Histidine kinase-like ATPase n=1 Tax=Gigaspora rosea TaxID=44941 RepID=A0A397VUD3_9GLOM|nr:hypothetical protein C2G38_2240915 [Gigaspora rosea]
MSLPSNFSNDYIENEKFANIVYNYNWSSTPLGPMDSWDPAIKTATSLCLKSIFPMCLSIGPPHWIQLYNKAWVPILKSKPCVIGMTLKEAWPEAYDIVMPLYDSVCTTKKGFFRNDDYYELQRDGYTEEVYLSYTYSPVFKSDGTVWALIVIAQETTQKVLNARRLKILGEFGKQMPEIVSLESACRITTKVLSKNVDIPYALIYFIKHNKLKSGSESLIARLTATTFDEDDSKKCQFPDFLPDTPEKIDLSKDANKSYDDKFVKLNRHAATYSFLKCDKSWPIDLVLKNGKDIKVLLKDGSQAVLLLASSFCDDKTLSAILICGVNRLRALDDKYMEFLQLVTNQMSTCLLKGKTEEEEKQRLKILADLNYQKVMFFQGISHELKTPLTLMLSPLEDVINKCPQDASITLYLQTIQRNAHRLLKLINTLLQFSSIETGQIKAQYRETNIIEFTQKLGSDFKNIAKKLGLDYNIDVPSPDEFNQAMGDKIYLDHDMYETIVFNLCSNALKHTWKGHINIRLYLDYKVNKKMVVLEVSDTGVGIPEVVLPNIFQRFYRVESQGSRSHEGTGIGLALVKELMARHGGDITVTSAINQGTTFKCWFPIGCEHLPANQIYLNDENQTSYDRELYTNRQFYLKESSQWIKNSISESHDIIDQMPIDNQDMDIDITNNNKMLTKDNTTANEKHQVLLVEDNNDMRDYLAALLKEFDLHRACDGQDALMVLKKLNKLPDLILNIMMPNMNGYELLDVLRSNEKTRSIPIILLSAKADEDSKVRGLDKGADDYLIKPFSAQELITRIRSNIKLSLIRQKIIFQHCKQEEIKQLLLSISNKITSKLNLDETFLYVAKEIYNKLPCERISIISNKQIASESNRIFAIYEDLENKTAINNDSFTERKSEEFNNLQEFLKNNLEIKVFLDVYCDEIQKNVSMLSVEVRLNNDLWGWIKAYRPSNSIWLVSEIGLLQQISNHISLAITYAILLEENTKKAIQMKAAEAANNIKNQILANTSHELRTPLGAIIGVLTSIESAIFTDDQKDMINILLYASDIVLLRINEILNVVKLEAPNIILMNKTFNLLELFENTIEKFGKGAGVKNIELILNCDVDELSRYVKSDPERLDQVLSHLLLNSFAFTERAEIILTISMQSQEVINENEENSTYGQMLKKGNLLIELHDTGVGMDPEYMQHIWKSFSQGNKSGLSICKSLVEVNGGKIEVESQLGKGSKYWFTWDVELLSITSPLLESKFGVVNYIMKQKRILIIHPIENVRNSMLKYLKNFEKVDAFNTFDKGINAAKKYIELYGRSAYDIVFIGLYKNNEPEVMKAVLELRGLEINNDNLAIIFITFQSNEGNQQVKKFIRKVGGMVSVIYTPITWNKLINQFINIMS